MEIEDYMINIYK